MANEAGRMVNPHAVNLAVMAGRGDRNDNRFDLSRGEFHGTAFCIARELFLTAAHVYDAARAGGEVAVARLTPEKPQVQTVSDVEVFPDVDLALLRCRNLWAEILPFNFSPLYYLAEVAAMGFAFGLELAENEGEPHIHQLRAFKGHVITRRALTTLPAIPPCYEVSFVPPPGLSGAPLLVLHDESVAITGVVLKHHRAEVAGRHMDLGLAIDAQELLMLESGLVGGSLAESVFGQSRPTRRGRRR